MTPLMPWATLNQFTSQVVIFDDHEGAWQQTWKMIPVKVETVFTPASLSSSLPSGNLDSGFLPSYDGGVTGQSTARTQHAEPERDHFGTIVSEVTVVTTHKRYRVPDP